MGESEGWSPPERFDEFAVLRPLGRGGMGHVYLARDVALDRPVALKFIAGEASGTSRRRFLTEARALARLGHPNVVGVFRVGELEGRPFIAYEFVPGRTLQQIERPLPWPMALRISVGLARGLAEAHRAGILHRDLKPSNAMLSPAGAVKLLDFGLARLEGEGEGGDVDRAPSARSPGSGPHGWTTRAGAMMGTPACLAPEQWLGEAASPRSDVYSLGLVLYELLAGRTPHPRSADPEELARAVLSVPNPPLRTACAEVPESLARVIDRCLRREPLERYETAGPLARELEDLKSVFLPLSGEEAPVSLERDAVAVAESFARVVPELDRFTVELFQRLFAARPDLRGLFPASMDSQRAKVAHALRLTLEGLHEPERLVPALEDLGRRHRDFHVPASGYEAFAGVLLETLRVFRPGEWNDSLEQAWTRAVAFITGTMQRGQGLAASTLASRAPVAVPGSADAAHAPRTRWADAGGVSIAYQEFGAGPHDIVLTFGWLTHVEMSWRHPALAGFLRRLGTLGRVIHFDKRGVGLSDRGQQTAALDDWVADMLAVMDAVGSRRAVICGVTQGVAPCVATAALHPERVAGVVLYGGAARTLRALDHPFGITPEALEQRVEDIRTRWGDPLFVEANAPSMSADPGFRAWWAEAFRMSASPSQAIAILRATAEIDLRALLPRIAAPTLVLHRGGDRVVSLDEGRDLAARVPGARLVELSGEDHLPYTGDVEPFFAELGRFLGSL